MCILYNIAQFYAKEKQFGKEIFGKSIVTSNSFPQPYSMKVLHVKNARPHEKIFIPMANAMTQSLVFPPEHVDQTQAAVVAAKVGNGYLVYAGDVNPEKGSDKIIQSLLGL
ncbi:hypothetical protein MMC22_007729 [Lobaria immixta]|nr:hypothetical protein [Lobaria immixta]